MGLTGGVLGAAQMLVPGSWLEEARRLPAEYHERGKVQASVDARECSRGCVAPVRLGEERFEGTFPKLWLYVEERSDAQERRE